MPQNTTSTPSTGTDTESPGATTSSVTGTDQIGYTALIEPKEGSHRILPLADEENTDDFEYLAKLYRHGDEPHTPEGKDLEERTLATFRKMAKSMFAFRRCMDNGKRVEQDKIEDTIGTMVGDLTKAQSWMQAVIRHAKQVKIGLVNTKGTSHQILRQSTEHEYGDRTLVRLIPEAPDGSRLSHDFISSQGVRIDWTDSPVVTKGGGASSISRAWQEIAMVKVEGKTVGIEEKRLLENLSEQSEKGDLPWSIDGVLLRQMWSEG